MSKLTINVGTEPNDGLGDPLRVAMEKCNDNFTEIYTAGPVSSNLRIANNSIVSTVANSDITITANGTGRLNLGDPDKISITGGSNAWVLSTDGTGNLSWKEDLPGPNLANVTVNIIPAANLTYNLGGSTRQWAPFDLDFERTIVAVDGDWITVDAPVLCAIEQRWGGGAVLPFDDRARVRECGVENLRAVSAFDREVRATHRGERYFSDEAHARTFVQIDGANDCWVRGVRSEGFTFACVDLRRTRGVTVADSFCGAMVSQLTGSRRYPFSVNGQRTLVVRCEADTGRHDFVVGSRVAGPNVFLDCRSGRQYATSEPHHRWSVGGLYDNVRSDIAVQDRGYMGTGHGWAGANYVLWNCEGRVVCQRPPTADNWVIGHVGERSPGAFPGRPEGRFIEWGRHIVPRSLYEWQAQAAAK